MDTIFNLIEGDLCSLLFLLLLILGLGSAMVHTRPALMRAGQRLAVAALLAFIGFRAWIDVPATADDWISILLRGFMAAGLTLGVAWIGLAVLAVLARWTVSQPAAAFRAWWSKDRTRKALCRTEREARCREATMRAEERRRAPERERARLQVDAEAKARAEAQRRREGSRASALLSFSFYAAKLGDRFPRAMFDQYVERYMADTHPPEVVEQRGRELIAIFEKHLADVVPAKRTTSIESLSRWYEETKAHIQALPLDEGVKDIRLIDLEKRFDELLSKHLEGTEP
jgi:hypothetical protein